MTLIIFHTLIAVIMLKCWLFNDSAY